MGLTVAVHIYSRVQVLLAVLIIHTTSLLELLSYVNDSTNAVALDNRHLRTELRQ